MHPNFQKYYETISMFQNIYYMYAHIDVPQEIIEYLNLMNIDIAS